MWQIYTVQLVAVGLTFLVRCVKGRLGIVDPDEFNEDVGPQGFETENKVTIVRLENKDDRNMVLRC